MYFYSSLFLLKIQNEYDWPKRQRRKLSTGPTGTGQRCSLFSMDQSVHKLIIMSLSNFFCSTVLYIILLLSSSVDVWRVSMIVILRFELRGKPCLYRDLTFEKGNHRRVLRHVLKFWLYLFKLSVIKNVWKSNETQRTCLHIKTLKKQCKWVQKCALCELYPNLILTLFYFIMGCLTGRFMWRRELLCFTGEIWIRPDPKHCSGLGSDSSTHREYV